MKHNKEITLYCKQEETCICHICEQEEHHNHTTISINKIMNEKKEEIKLQQDEHQVKLKINKIQKITKFRI